MIKETFNIKKKQINVIVDNSYKYTYIFIDRSIDLNDMADQLLVLLMLEGQLSKFGQQGYSLDGDVVLAKVVGIASNDASDAVVEGFGGFNSVSEQKISFIRIYRKTLLYILSIRIMKNAKL